MGEKLASRFTDPARFHPERGIVLVGALWVMTFMALIVVSFVSAQQVELKVVGGYGDRTRARLLARSAIDHVVARLAADETEYDCTTDDWYDDPDTFDQVALGDGFYTLIAPPAPGETETRRGIVDEAGKVNINMAPKEVLEEIPGMSAALAEALIDWRDEDDETTGEGGAESDWYMRLDPPYNAKNAPFDTMEELLMVKGFTPSKLYGEDANRNGVLDPNENDGEDSLPADDRDGELDKGLLDYLTVYSYEPLQSQGQPKVNLNEAQIGQLRQRLGDVLDDGKITWIAEYRKASLAGQEIFPDKKYVTPSNVVPVVPVPGVQGTPLSFDDYRLIADRVTVAEGETVQGLINVNTAPVDVLKALPQITDEEADTIVAERIKEDVDISNITWIHDVLTGSEPEKLGKFQALEPFLTVRSLQFTIQAVGVVPGRGATARLLVVLDRATAPVRFLYWKDVSRLGAPFPPPTREEWEAVAGTGD